MKKEKVELIIDAKHLSPLAHPLAEHKLQKKLHKCIKKGTQDLLSAGFLLMLHGHSFYTEASEARSQGGCQSYQEGGERVCTICSILVA